MQKTASNKSNTQIAVRNYAVGIGFCCVVGLLTWVSEDPSNLIALKVIFAPIFLLASRAIPDLYKQPVMTDQINARLIESHLLFAALFAGYMAVLSWTPEKPLNQILVTLLINFGVMAIFQMVLVWMRIRDTRRLIDKA